MLKEQKALKRKKEAPVAAAAAAAAAAAEVAETETETAVVIATIPRSKAPTLLPASLLENLSDRPSAPIRSHKRVIDEDASGEDEDDMDGMDDMDIDMGGLGGFDAEMEEAMALADEEKRRKRREARKAKMEFKKGPVTVKVLKDEKKSRKLMMPPANKKVAKTKSNWLNGRGIVKRRPVGGIRGAFK